MKDDDFTQNELWLMGRLEDIALLPKIERLAAIGKLQKECKERGIPQDKRDLKMMVRDAIKESDTEDKIEAIKRRGLIPMDVSKATDMMTKGLRQVEDLLRDKNLAFNFGGKPFVVRKVASSLGHAFQRDENGDVVCDEKGDPIKEPLIVAAPQLVTSGVLRRLAHRVVEFGYATDEGWKSAYVPDAFVSALTATLGGRLNALTGVTHYPVMHKGELICGQGYHADTGLWISTGDIVIQEFDDPVEAYEFLRDKVFCDFPFESEADFVVALSFAMSLLIAKTENQGEEGPPITIFSATRHNIGKTLLASLLVEIITGQSCPMADMPESRDELKKMLSTMVAESSPVAVFDNMPRGWNIGNSAIDNFVTARAHMARLLGQSKEIVGPAATVIAFTGNAIRPRMDTRSRSLTCSLHIDPDVNLATRNYVHPNIIKYVRENRGLLLGALEAIMNAKPTGERMHGRFPNWNRFVAAPLQAVSGININEYWREIGAESEVTGTDLTPVMEILNRFSTDGHYRMDGEWITPKEAFQILPGEHWDLFKIGDTETVTTGSTKVAAVLGNNAGNRFGDYILHKTRENLGKRTDHKVRALFRVAYKPQMTKARVDDEMADLHQILENNGRLRSK
ncbi:hypothetical protein [Ruegeria sp. HKCCC2117]|uniref:hypothetical protein n=1 Tax=Ruegeria sp. HKCCC2117 TaxID=2682992 RepID=UPI001487E6BB|nr:hypothetical protein [Ruegeria sp. HKCCC2117]